MAKMSDNKNKGKGEPPSKQQAASQSGNIYQAGGDIYVNQPPTASLESGKVLTNFHKYIGIAAGIAGILVIGFITIPNACNSNKQNSHVQGTGNNQQKDSLLVTGIVREMNTKKGIPNAIVTNNLNIHNTVTTTSDGTFEFEVSGTPGSSIRIYVSADGFNERNELHVLGSPVEVELERK